MAKFNADRAATVLLDALITSDAKAVARFGVSLRSLQTWRQRLRTDPDFASFFTKKKRELETSWVEDLSVPIRASARLITEAANGADALTMKNPEFIHAMAGALKICAELKIVCKVIDARYPAKGATAVEGWAEASEVAPYVS